jgi:hypothetical protein
MRTTLLMDMKPLLVYLPSNAMVTLVPVDVVVPLRSYPQSPANMHRALALILLMSAAFAVLLILFCVAGMFSACLMVYNRPSTASNSCLRQKKVLGSPVIAMWLP